MELVRDVNGKDIPEYRDFQGPCISKRSLSSRPEYGERPVLAISGFLEAALLVPMRCIDLH